MNSSTSDNGIALCVVLLPDGQPELDLTVNNILQQDYPYKTIVVVHSCSTRLGVNIDFNGEVRFRRYDSGSLSECIYKILFSEEADYVSFWYQSQWSHCSRILRQVNEMKEKYKRVSVPTHYMLVDVENTQVLISPRCLNFSAAVWQLSYLKELGKEGVNLVLGLPFDRYRDIFSDIVPVNIPYLFIQLAKNDEQLLGRADDWFTAVPLNEHLGTRICHFLREGMPGQELSNYLVGTEVTRHFNYLSCLNENVVL